ncbi:NUDIX domain-containing protein [Nocardiopsis sp. NPDC050513]|uniref:NUDIX domain-containing protein n=1 Tax=Nocardiopsis sp. NPDC050513 TaxID=3364338 RepID=UPI003790AD57
MNVVMAKPDALAGPAASARRDQAQGFLLGLARHLDPSVPLSESSAVRADRAARQVRERAESEPAFAGRPRHGGECSARLLGLAELLPPGAIATADLLTLSLEGIGFSVTHHADHTLSEQDVDAIYQEATAADYRELRPQLIDYLAGQPVRVLWLDGDQHPALLQHWKTYVRHLLLERPPGGGHLLRNLVHVCEGEDAHYLTSTLDPRPWSAREEDMTDFTWHTDPVPPDMRVRQVYGFLFDEEGRVLLRVEGSTSSLPGGRPEPQDTDFGATLRREADEEVTADIGTPHYLGYQRVDDRDGTPPYAQVRMVARVNGLRESRPDPDTGRTYQREFVAPHVAADRLAWGEPGRLQVAAAAEAARSLLNLPVSTDTRL